MDEMIAADVDFSATGSVIDVIRNAEATDARSEGGAFLVFDGGGVADDSLKGERGGRGAF